MEKTALDILWMTISASLVFLMQGGFLCLEAGLTRSKNNINVALKNLSDIGVSILVFWGFGYAFMFGNSRFGWIGWTHFALETEQRQIWSTVFFFYQAMFCGTAVTIVSGAVAERMRFRSYMIVAGFIAGCVYPLFGHWAWNGTDGSSLHGWLGVKGFVDFAGSTVVHSVGGWVALATLLVIGPRHGRFAPNGAARKIPGSNLPVAMLGVVLLWLGWFGFNGGSTLAMNDQVPLIVVNTLLAGAAGLVVTIVVGLCTSQRIDADGVLNGALAGLVAITANCFAVTAAAAVIIGGVGGMVMLGVTKLLRQCRIDDAVGAVPVHLGAGIWGTLAVALVGKTDVLATGLDRMAQLQVQVLGIVVCGLWAFGMTYPLLKLLNRFVPLRVTPEEEEMGLNVSEHGASTELFALFRVMERQTKTGDLSLRAPVEPFTQVGQIASMYNRVMQALEQAVGRIQASFSMLRATLESTADGILVVNTSGKMIEMNQKFLTMWQLPQEIGQSQEEEQALAYVAAQLVDPEGFLSQVRALYNQPEVESYDVLTCSDGRVLERYSRPQRVGGQCVGRVWSFRDVTERFQAEKARQQLEAQLRQSQKMEALGTLAGGIAHDLNNVLTVMLGNTEMFMVTLPEEHTGQKYLQHISTAGKRAANLVKQILTFSRMEPLHLRPVNIAPVVQEALQMVRATIPATIEIRQDIQADSPAIMADVTQIHQIILNLCTNAYHAMRARGGVIDVRLKPVPQEPAPLAERAAPSLMLTVRDTGCGIPRAMQEKIFDPFFTTKGVGLGTGLGLAVVHGIVKNHQGTIAVESEVDHGALFTITFPTITGTEPLASPAAKVPVRQSKGHILCVDDEPSITTLYQEYFAALGFAVTVCSDGREALQLFQARPDHYDVVVTDQAMPQLTGKQLSEKLLAIRPDVPIILTTGYSDAISAEDASTLGIYQYVMKPVKLQTLHHMIVQAL